MSQSYNTKTALQKPSWSSVTTAGRYVPSHDTDIRATFARVRQEMAAASPKTKRSGKANPLHAVATDTTD